MVTGSAHKHWMFGGGGFECVTAAPRVQKGVAEGGKGQNDRNCAMYFMNGLSMTFPNAGWL